MVTFDPFPAHMYHIHWRRSQLRWEKNTISITFLFVKFEIIIVRNSRCNDLLPIILTALKRVYMITRNPYLYSVRNFPLYLIWDITNTLHADITSSLCPPRLWVHTYLALGTFPYIRCRMLQTLFTLCPTRLWAQRDEHPYKAKQILTQKSKISFDIISNDSFSIV